MTETELIQHMRFLDSIGIFYCRLDWWTRAWITKRNFSWTPLWNAMISYAPL